MLRFVSFIFKTPCPPHNYTPISNKFGSFSLTERRHSVGIKFIVELLNAGTRFIVELL